MNKYAVLAMLCVAIASPLASPLGAQAPAFDNSGNQLLNGTYYFRQVIYVISTSGDSEGVAGDTTDSIAIYGNISFDGNGNYTIAGGASGGVISDANVGAPEPLSCYLADTTCTSGSPVTGTYAVSASGYAYISSPVGPLTNGDLVHGLVSKAGIFVGSSTETGSNYSDMFIAAPLASPAPTNPTFQGNYTVTGYLPPTGAGSSSPFDSANVFFQMNPDGNGNLGTVNIAGYYGGGGTSTLTQSAPNTKYFFSNGAAVVTFPTDSTATLLYGQEYFYFSPDGNFFFGGSPTYGYDMVVGVRNATGTQNFSGLYYESGVDEDVSQLNNLGYANFDAYYGSIDATSNGTIVAHDRLNSIFNSNAIGSTYADSFTAPITAPYTDPSSSFQYAVGAGGAIRIGAGVWPFLGLTVALQAPTFTPTQSVYLDPTGIVNAASFSPFTAGISNGEFITLFGTNLAPTTVVSSSVPYPPILGGVQVMINGVAAPIYYVTPGQLAVITPSANPYSLATVQVINNGVSSNIVTMPVFQTVPGVYTVPSGGVGYGATVHTNGQIVSPSNPAAPGETVEVFATGLGTAYPPVPDGAAPPSSPLSYTVNTITAAVGGDPATVTFAGLAPTLAGLYQINVTMPSDLTAGDYTLDIAGSVPAGSATNPDSYAAQALISIGGTAAADRPATAASRRHLKKAATASTKRAPACFGHACAASTAAHEGRPKPSTER
ncbi:MAG TPA: hypothetical protein VHZ74_09410 [Bryobacteraceae bacterium]|nr:hypothetical protein [Bryobacteraceae bacterium]